MSLAHTHQMSYEKLQPPAPPSAALSGLGYLSGALVLGILASTVVLITAGVNGNVDLFWAMFSVALALGALAVATYLLAPKCIPLPSPIEADDDDVDIDNATRV